MVFERMESALHGGEKGFCHLKAVYDTSIASYTWCPLDRPLIGAQSSSCKIDVCNKNGWPCSVF